MNGNFEVKYTIRLYDPALISELATQFEKSQDEYRNKNEFFTHIIELGLKENRKEMKTTKGKRPAAEAEEDNIYPLLLEVFRYTSNQFKKIYIDHNVLQRLLCAMYNILIALNNDERLMEEKIKDGFFDDLPPRFEEIIADLKKRYGIS